MPRFRLDSSKTAMENLYDAAKMATAVIMRSHSYYHLYGEYRDELFDIIRDATVAHFVQYKVRRHTYARTSKDGRPLNFADNVLSSCFSVAGNQADTFMKRLTLLNTTTDIEPLKYSISSGLPRYISFEEARDRRDERKKKPGNNKLEQFYRAKRIREEYEDFVLECREMGISCPDFGAWLSREGYSRDEELMWRFEDRKVRRSMIAERLAHEKEAELVARLGNSELHRKEYAREYARRRREKERTQVDRELREVLGAPSEGYQWFRYSNGTVGQRRIKRRNDESDI